MLLGNLFVQALKAVAPSSASAPRWSRWRRLTLISISIPIPGTPFEASVRSEGRIVDDDLRHYDGDHLVFHPNRVTPREVLANIVNCPGTNVRAGVAAYLKIPEHSLTLKKLEWLGLLSDRIAGR